MFGFLKNISPTEMLVLGAVFVLIFGSSIFIKLGRTGGQTLKEIKNIKKNLTEAIGNEGNESKKS